MPLFSKLFIANRILYSPLETLFLLLVFILSKDFGLTPFQLTLLASIKPISSLFSFYVSSAIFERPQSIRSYLLINNCVGALPCLLYPFIENVWFYIGSFAVFMITTRASLPAWIEVLKRNLAASDLSTTVSRGNSVFYLTNILLSPLLCFFMDQQADLWRYLFASFGVLTLLNMFLVLFIELGDAKVPKITSLIEPLKKGYTLLRENPPFAHCLVMYFLGGVAIIGSQAILPTYFKDNLDLSYSQLGMAFSFCKGVSFILTSPHWSRYSVRLSLYHLNCLANLFSVLFFVCLMTATRDHTIWLYIGYMFYGTMSAGHELSSNLSGPFFSGTKNSTIYSSLNLGLSGLRGCICPFLCALLFAYTDSMTVFTVCALISMTVIVYGLWIDRRYKNNIAEHASC